MKVVKTVLLVAVIGFFGRSCYDLPTDADSEEYYDPLPSWDIS